MINVSKVLDEAIKKDASDIHFIVENKPMLRIARELIPSENADVLTEEDMNTIYDFLVKGNIEADKVFQETRKLDIGPLLKNEVPIRVFPLQANDNGNKDWVSMGMFATKNNPNDIKVNIRDLFEVIPDNVTEEDFLNNDENSSQE